MNDFSEFSESLQSELPPENFSDSLKALWYDAKGDWETSHNIAQEIPGKGGSRIHAYLHRKEGDRWNAGYWYDRASKPFPEMSLEDEFCELLRFFCHPSEK
jgi:hypothetical protein